MADEIIVETTSTQVIEVSSPGPQGPAGAAGAGLTTLTNAGDLLYRNATEPSRLPIGSNGQVLKVSGGLPTWANESGAVSSVAGRTGAITLNSTDIASEQAIEVYEAGTADCNGFFIYGGLFNGRPTYYATKDTFIYWDGSNWVINHNGEDQYFGSSAIRPWDSVWSLGQGANPLPVVDKVTSREFEQIVGQRTNPTALGNAAGKNVGSGANDVAAGNHTHAAATQSVAGFLSAADKTKLDGIAAGAEVNVNADWNASSGDAQILNKPSTFAPSAHSGSHAATGSDPLAPSDIGAQSLFTSSSQVVSADVTLASGRATKWTIENYNGTNYNITLPTSNNQAGDVIVVVTGTLVGSQTIRKLNFGSNYTTLATLSDGQSYRFIATVSGAGSWQIDPVYTHEHNASAITSGTFDIARIPTGTGSTQVALGDHSHELTSLAATGATNGHVLTANGSGGVTFAALPASGVTGAAASASDVLGVSGANITGVDANADRIIFFDDSAGKLTHLTVGSGLSISDTTISATASGGVTAVGASTADVLSVSGSDLVADDGGLIDSSDPFIKWDDVAGKLVYANPLSRTAGAFYVGAAPTTTALGTNAVNIQPSRAAATQVASGTDGPVAIGQNTTAGNQGGVAIGQGATANVASVAIGRSASTTSSDATAVGASASAGTNASAFGRTATASASMSVALGDSVTASLRGQFATRPFSAIYWSGQTTTNAATILNLDGTATNRFTIAASTALAVDILLVARRATTQDKWLVARRFLGICRDGSNNTALIGTVQTLGTDQSAGSPTWTFALTADDTNEALKLEVTGATGETVEWRATAFYRVA